MKIKELPEDFRVDEIFDLKSFEKKNEGKVYYYFLFEKKDYNQIKAIELVSKVFNVGRKGVHFAGTKDKTGITTQVVSVQLRNENNLDENLKYFNSKYDDLKLEFIGKFNGRINLGDNLGNQFKIVVRDVVKEEVEKAKKRVEESESLGILNYFDSQRFGFANNSHIIGEYVLENKIEDAVFEILTSLPIQNPSDELVKFANFVRDNRNEIKNQNKEIIDKAIFLIPEKFKRDYEPILNHLAKAKNDFPGAFRTIHKKLRTLYVNAYQSDLFNKEIEKSSEDSLELFDISSHLNHMPELKPKEIVSRKVRVFPKDLKIGEIEKDELNEGKFKVEVSFKLGSGEYATNVIKYLFEKDQL